MSLSRRVHYRRFHCIDIFPYHLRTVIYVCTITLCYLWLHNNIIVTDNDRCTCGGVKLSLVFVWVAIGSIQTDNRSEVGGKVRGQVQFCTCLIYVLYTGGSYSYTVV